MNSYVHDATLHVKTNDCSIMARAIQNEIERLAEVFAIAVDKRDAIEAGMAADEMSRLRHYLGEINRP